MKHNYPVDITQKMEQINQLRFTKPETVVQYCQEILEYAQTNDDTYLISYAYLYIGDAYLTLGKLSESIPKLIIAATYQESHHYYDLLVKTYNILAITYYNQGDELLALDTYYKGLMIAIHNQDYIMQGMLYNNIGATYLDFKDYTQAMHYFSKSYSVSKKSSDTDNLSVSKARKYINYSVCMISQGNIEKTKEYMQKLNSCITKEEERTEYYSICSLKCTLFVKTNEYEKAASIGHLIAQLPLHELKRLEFYNDFIEILNNLIEMKQYQDAKTIIDKLEVVVSHEPTSQRWMTLLDSEIKYHQSRKDKNKLADCYLRFYDCRKTWLSEVKSSIITAIDNRLYLEQETSENERLESDNKKLSELSEQDQLTGLKNRYGWKRYYQSHFSIAKTKQQTFGLIILDIDCLKQYNDTYGHPKGDICIQQVAQCISETVPNGFMTARYGGDEFFIASVNTTDAELKRIAAQILSAVREKKLILSVNEGNTMYVSVTLGIINAIPQADQTIADFIHGADTALYQIKESTKNDYCFLTAI